MELGPSQPTEEELSSINSSVEPSILLSEPNSDFHKKEIEMNLSKKCDIQISGHKNRAYEGYDDSSKDPNGEKRLTY